MLSRTARIIGTRLARPASGPLLRPAAAVRFNSAPADVTAGERAIEDKLRARFAPSQVQVQDISGGCGSFYAISITSAAFRDLSIIKQHRLVNDTLKEDIAGIHGLQLKTIAE